MLAPWTMLSGDSMWFHTRIRHNRVSRCRHNGDNQIVISAKTNYAVHYATWLVTQSGMCYNDGCKYLLTTEAPNHQQLQAGSTLSTVLHVTYHPPWSISTVKEQTVIRPLGRQPVSYFIIDGCVSSVQQCLSDTTRLLKQVSVSSLASNLMNWRN